ncbi:GNAT family N-acetyltransferase [Streptomyces sp. bgisy153]|uniref:GNAT family N-acetyltransferase n=1 Tax=Streptomyces sp. bgisy153 TaxID=3413793 RepID=UPI003D72B729
MQELCIKEASAADLGGVRAVMLDAVYRDFGTGYVPRWHADIIDPVAFYLAPPRHTLLVAVDERDGTVAATAALDARGPAHPPNPRRLAERYPSGETAQLRRVYVRPEFRRRGLARRLVAGLVDFAEADGGYRSVYLHAYPHSPGAMGLWRALGEVVCDEREEVPGGGSGVVHFEIPLPK